MPCFRACASTRTLSCVALQKAVNPARGGGGDGGGEDGGSEGGGGDGGGEGGEEGGSGAASALGSSKPTQKAQAWQSQSRQWLVA